MVKVIIANEYENSGYTVYAGSEAGIEIPGFSFAISNEADPDLKKMLFAALKTYMIGNESIDRVLKKYGDSWNFPITKVPKHLKFIHKILDLTLQELSAFSSKMYKAHSLSPDRVGVIAADVALERILSSFEAISFLLRRGFSIEARILARTILEQTAWAYKAYSLDDPREILKIDSKKCISELKTIDSQVGYLYGEFSRYVHLDSRSRHSFFAIEKNRPQVIRRNSYDAANWTALLIRLADIYECTYEKLHIDQIKSPNCWQTKKGKLILKKSRYLNRLWEKNKKEVGKFDLIKLSKAGYFDY